MNIGCRQHQTEGPFCHCLNLFFMTVVPGSKLPFIFYTIHTIYIIQYGIVVPTMVIFKGYGIFQKSNFIITATVLLSSPCYPRLTQGQS